MLDARTDRRIRPNLAAASTAIERLNVYVSPRFVLGRLFVDSFQILKAKHCSASPFLSAVA